MAYAPNCFILFWFEVVNHNHAALHNLCYEELQPVYCVRVLVSFLHKLVKTHCNSMGNYYLHIIIAYRLSFSLSLPWLCLLPPRRTVKNIFHYSVMLFEYYARGSEPLELNQQNIKVIARHSVWVEIRSICHRFVPSEGSNAINWKCRTDNTPYRCCVVVNRDIEFMKQSLAFKLALLTRSSPRIHSWMKIYIYHLQCIFSVLLHFPHA